MARTTIPWNDGSGDNIYLDYAAASGNQTVSVSSDANAGASSRSKTITFSGSGITRELTVNQNAGSTPPPSSFTRAHAHLFVQTAANSITIPNVSGQPRAFILTAFEPGAGVLAVVGDSTGVRGVYNTGSRGQHNFSDSFTASYSNGSLTVTAPSGVNFIAQSSYNLIYYYGSGTLTFRQTSVAPASGITAVTFTDTPLTAMPVMYATLLESQVSNAQYRRVAYYTNSGYDNEEGVEWPEGVTFATNGPSYTTNSFTASYNNGLYINSGGTNAGGYFHNPGTYRLYYLMASDVS